MFLYAAILYALIVVVILVLLRIAKISDERAKAIHEEKKLYWKDIEDGR